jgi:hypothetical protein
MELQVNFLQSRILNCLLDFGKYVQDSLTDYHLFFPLTAI